MVGDGKGVHLQLFGFRTMELIRFAPSSSEYSVWLWMWQNVLHIESELGPCRVRRADQGGSYSDVLSGRFAADI